MNDLPPELEARRDEIHDRVVKRGQTIRMQRRLGVVAVVVVAVGLPVAALGLTTGDNGAQQIESVSPRNGDAPTTSTTAIAPTTSTEPSTPSTMIVPPTANSDCRNSTNPVCGPLRYDPPLTNAPAEMEVAMSPPRPKPGLAVTFTIHITDPDSYLSTGDNYCGENDFGDDNRSLCIADCAGPRERYGPWTPPPAEAGDETYTVRHTYTKVGTYTAKFSTIAGMCSERPSQVSSSVTVDVWP